MAGNGRNSTSASNGDSEIGVAGEVGKVGFSCGYGISEGYET